jgi:hypothetical protein
MFAEDEDVADRGRVLRLKTSNQTQNRAFAATAGAQDADELALLGQIGHDKINVANRRELIGPIHIECLGDAAELDDVRGFSFFGLADMVQDLADADFAGGLGCFG